MSRGILFACLPVFCLWLAACGAASYSCNDRMGCLEIPSDGPIVIGVILANTKEYSQTSQIFHESIELALTNKGGYRGHAYELIQRTTDCSLQDIQAAALEFTNHPELAAVIAPACTEAAQTAIPFLINAGIAFLSPVPDPASAFSLTEQILINIEQVSTVQSDHGLLIPRFSLLESVNPLEVKLFLH